MGILFQEVYCEWPFAHGERVWKYISSSWHETVIWKKTTERWKLHLRQSVPQKRLLRSNMTLFHYWSYILVQISEERLSRRHRVHWPKIYTSAKLQYFDQGNHQVVHRSLVLTSTWIFPYHLHDSFFQHWTWALYTWVDKNLFLLLQSDIHSTLLMVI